MPFLNLCSVIFKSKSKLARYEHIAGEVVSFEPSYIMMTDEQLVRRSDVLRNHAKDDAGGLSGFVTTNALALIREHIRVMTTASVQSTSESSSRRWHCMTGTSFRR